MKLLALPEMVPIVSRMAETHGGEGMKKEKHHYSNTFMAQTFIGIGLTEKDAKNMAAILGQFDFYLKKQVGKVIMFFSKGTTRP